MKNVAAIIAFLKVAIGAYEPMNRYGTLSKWFIWSKLMVNLLIARAKDWFCVSRSWQPTQIVISSCFEVECFICPSIHHNLHISFSFTVWLQIKTWACFELFKLTSLAVVFLENTASFVNAFPRSSDVCDCWNPALVPKGLLLTTDSIYRGSGLKSCSHLSLSRFISVQWCLSFSFRTHGTN